ncbi:glycosyltransferase [Lactococcus allomyrinae]|uniref:Glycosyltransferase n=1 Tax=Lactococcus allomyrinae TaxID=2419773 RepID=A0A387BFN7_9LACT|nr:glycosyltransferase family 2 protein [Lactococcus allomyrinae]AYG01084.1 glycosyltransferase [Lactococcus allomyrinae]
MKIMTYLSMGLLLYPLLAAIAYTIGGYVYHRSYKGKIKTFYHFKPEEEPLVTIMVPAHNEEVVIEDTLNYLAHGLNYHNYEILVIDDASTDLTVSIVQRMKLRIPNLRLIQITENHGKAHAFNIGMGFAKGEYVLSNDADTTPEPDAIWKYVNYFVGNRYQNTGAVTANMGTQNRNGLLEKSTTVEFASIMGLIKRAQQGTLGSVYAFNGANTMYRKAAALDVGGFRQDRATEDISIAWDMQYNGWRAIFAPEILFYMNIPDNGQDFYHQRLRWAMGGTESFIDNFRRIFRHPIKNINKVIMLIDQFSSITWCLYYFLTTITMLVDVVLFMVIGEYSSASYTFQSFVIFLSFMVVFGLSQLILALVLDDSGKKMKYLLFAPLYLLFFWQINVITVVNTIFLAIKNTTSYDAKGNWKSPTRVKINKDETDN